jgi:ArsR family transcriptional regulator
MVDKTNRDNYGRLARYLKALSHPVRLSIVGELSSGKKCVTDIHDILAGSQPNISKHLIVLRNAGIVNFTKDKQQRCYFIEDRAVLKALKILQDSKSGKAHPHIRKPKKTSPESC